jgi:hypothetical protein
MAGATVADAVIEYLGVSRIAGSAGECVHAAKISAAEPRPRSLTRL